LRFGESVILAIDPAASVALALARRAVVLSFLSQRSSFMRALRFRVVRTVGVVATTLVCAYLIAAESKPTAAKTPDLQQRVAALEDKAAQLEKKLEQVQQGYVLAVPPTATPPQVAPRVPNAPQATPGAPLPAIPPTPPGVPPNAVPREFNGQTYYIVPLAKEASR
jgi:hypothetical protein